MNLSIKNIPEGLLELLRERAKRHHRSLQGEVITILEGTVTPRTISIDEVRQRIRELDISTGDESAKWVRELRDARWPAAPGCSPISRIREVSK